MAKLLRHGVSKRTCLRGMIAGMAGGLAGTFAMYLFGAGIFAILSWPTNTSLMIIGDSAAAFFQNFGIELAGGIPLGLSLYTLIGLVMGAGFGIAVVCLEGLERASLGKMAGLGILYVEVLSVPLLAAGALALGMNFSTAALWFCISVVMHMVYGLVLGVVTFYGVGNRERDRKGVFDGSSKRGSND